MATKLKVVEQVADIVPAPELPQFDPAPTRKRRAGWTAERPPARIASSLRRLVKIGGCG